MMEACPRFRAAAGGGDLAVAAGAQNATGAAQLHSCNYLRHKASAPGPTRATTCRLAPEHCAGTLLQPLDIPSRRCCPVRAAMRPASRPASAPLAAALALLLTAAGVPSVIARGASFVVETGSMRIRQPQDIAGSVDSAIGDVSRRACVGCLHLGAPACEADQAPPAPALHPLHSLACLCTAAHSLAP